MAFTSSNGQTRSVAGGDQHHAAGGRGAGAAGDLHDYRAGAAVGHRGGGAQDADGKGDYRAAGGGDDRPRAAGISGRSAGEYSRSGRRGCNSRAWILRSESIYLRADETGAVWRFRQRDGRGEAGGNYEYFNRDAASGDEGKCSFSAFSLQLLATGMAGIGVSGRAIQSECMGE